jgi:hypothetical protein
VENLCGLCSGKMRGWERQHSGLGASDFRENWGHRFGGLLLYFSFCDAVLGDALDQAVAFR